MNPAVIGLLIQLGIKILPILVDTIKDLSDEDRERLLEVAAEDPQAVAQQVASIVARDTGMA